MGYEYFQQQYPNPDNFLALLTQVMVRIQRCDPAWAPPECIKLFPLPPQPDEPAFEGWAHPWQFGYKEAQALMGQTKHGAYLVSVQQHLGPGLFQIPDQPFEPFVPGRSHSRTRYHSLFDGACCGHDQVPEFEVRAGGSVLL